MFNKNLTFNPGLNLLRISQRKIRRFLWWFIFVCLILFGLYGLFALLKGWFFMESPSVYLRLFYLSLLGDMFAVYLLNREREKVNKIDSESGLKNLEVSLYLSSEAYKLLERTWLRAYRRGFYSLKPIHLFDAFLRQDDFKKTVKRLGCRPREVHKKAKSIIDRSLSQEGKSEKGGSPILSPELKDIFLKAYVGCLKNQRPQIEVLDIFAALVDEKNLVGLIFEEFGADPKQVKKVIRWRRIEKRKRQAEKRFGIWKMFKPKGKLNRAMTASVTRTLDKVSRDWTAMAKEDRFEMVLGQDEKLEKMFRFFASAQNGVILVGKSKVGKKAILKKLAQLMVEERVPDFLKDKRLVELNVGNLVSLTGAVEKGEEYLKKIIAEVNRAGNIVLVVRNVDRLVGLRTRESGLDFSEILASGLETKGFYFIGTAEPKAYASKIEGRILGNFLNKIKVPVPPRGLVWRILASKALVLEDELKITFSVESLDQAIVLADNYIYGKALTAKAIDLIVEAASSVRSRRGKKAVVKSEDIVELVSQKTEIPLGKLGKKEKQKLLDLEKLIHKRLIDQNEAVNAVADAMRRSRLRSETNERPIANFLFVGPTGVGKTQLAKTLARVYFGKEDRMIRLDMSEYQTKQSIDRIIGSIEGDRSRRGYLTEAVKREPYSLILLDEMEKAHPDILNLLLQLMDDGRLTDASGETINFTNVILIATSNAGTKTIQEKIQQGLKYHEIKDRLRENILLDYFSPEFLNRFDKVVLFKGLSMDDVVKIAYIFLKDVNKKLEKKGIEFEAEQEAVEELAGLGYDAMYGARPLRRTIQDKVEDPIAKLVLKEEVKRRDKIILKSGLQFEIEEAETL